MTLAAAQEEACATISPEPLIAIVTASFNAAADLVRTARSIRDQLYSNIEWIIIDGGSSDDTLEEIRRNQDIIKFWSSEPDRGIYDAWNKGCAHASGEWVLFLGAGDELAGADAIERCASYLSGARGKYEIVYGKIELMSPDGRGLGELGEPWSALQGKWGGLLPLLPPHPSSFHHRSILAGTKPFDSRFRYAGDTDFVVRSVLRRDPLFIPVLVDRMLAGGVSARPSTTLQIARERRAIASTLRVRAPFLHRARWHMTVLARLATLKLVPTSVRRTLGRRLRKAGRVGPAGVSRE